jgi:hypothetical protein
MTNNPLTVIDKKNQEVILMLQKKKNIEQLKSNPHL